MFLINLKKSITFAVVGALSVVCCINAEALNNLPDIAVEGPAVDFSSDDRFTSFVPPVQSLRNADPGAPEIAEWTRINEPGDTLVLTAESISTFSDTENRGRDTRFLVFGQGRGVADAEIPRIDARQVAVTLPDNLPQGDMYMMWPVSAAGIGSPVTMNQTELWWVGLDQVSPGEKFSIYGQNLTLGGGSAYIYIVGHGWEESISANPYKADFICPDLSYGSHTLYAHNGHGEKYGWSAPKTLNVQAPRVWSENQEEWVNVKAYGAKGDGINDDAQAIRDAYNTIRNAKEKTLYFPAGTYLLGSEFLMNGSGSVRVKGEDMEQTTIKPSKLLHPYKMLNVRSDHTRIEDITIESGGFGLLQHEPIFNVERCSDIRFTRMRLMQTNATSQVEDHFQALYADHLYFKDCEFYTARSVYMSFSSDIIIDHCKWFGVHDCNNMLGMETTRAAVFDCHSQMMDKSDASDGDGWAKGRWIAGGVRGWNNFYVGTSTTTNMAPRIATPFLEQTPIKMDPDELYFDDQDNNKDVYRRKVYFSSLSRPNDQVGSVKLNIPSESTGKYRGYDIVSYDQASGEIVFDFFGWEAAFVPNALPYVCRVSDNVDQNSSEQILFEGGNTSFRGSVSVASANSVTVSGYSEKPESADWGYVTIVDGRGLGQQRAILSNSGDTMNLEEDWRVIPDTTSRVVVGRFCDRFVVYDNDLDAVDRDEYSASVGFQITGAGHSIVVEKNTFSETRTGIANYAESQMYYNNENIVNPVFFGLYRNNILKANKDGVLSVFGIRPTSGDPYPDDKALMGNIFRNNSFNGVKDTGFLVRAQIGNHIGLQVLADSELLNVKDGVIETEYSSGLICMNNRFVGTGVGSGFTMSADSRPYLQGNSWTSFAKPYSGSVSGQVIAMPVRYLMLTGPDAEVLINNAGTDTLDWTASLEQGSWLRLVEGSGSVEAEKSASPVVIELDPAQPPPVVGSQEILTIKTGSISRNITVVYDPQSGSAAIDQQAYPLGYGDDPFRVEVFDGVTGETRIYNVPQGATEIIIEEWMIGDWSRMRIQRHNGTQWTTVHEEWMGRSSQINR